MMQCHGQLKVSAAAWGSFPPETLRESWCNFQSQVTGANRELAGDTWCSRRESSWVTCVCDVQIRPEAVYSWLMCSLLSCSQETYPLMSCKLFDKVTNSFTNIQTAVSFLITERLRDLSAASKIEKQHQMKYHTVQWLASWKCLFWSSVNFNWQIHKEFLENNVT